MWRKLVQWHQQKRNAAHRANIEFYKFWVDKTSVNDNRVTCEHNISEY
jgi:hypothetical protein